mgnify:CR=1 FL=1
MYGPHGSIEQSSCRRASWPLVLASLAHHCVSEFSAFAELYLLQHTCLTQFLKIKKHLSAIEIPTVVKPS